MRIPEEYNYYFLLPLKQYQSIHSKLTPHDMKNLKYLKKSYFQINGQKCMEKLRYCIFWRFRPSPSLGKSCVCVLNTNIEIYKKQLMVYPCSVLFSLGLSFSLRFSKRRKKKSMKFIEMESESRKENGKKKFGSISSIFGKCKKWQGRWNNQNTKINKKEKKPKYERLKAFDELNNEVGKQRNCALKEDLFIYKIINSVSIVCIDFLQESRKKEIGKFFIEKFHP
jgi:hypothetical protein